MSVAVRTPRRGTATAPAPAPRPGLRTLAGEQALVAGAQAVSGLGNAAFALIAAHLLAPGGFAQVAAFLALYLLVHVPASSLSAGSALDGGLASRARRRVLRGGLVLAGAVALIGAPLAPVVGLAPALALVLAAGVPAAMPLALERGRLFGARRHGRAAASLLVEPVVRLAAGVPLALGAGPTGAAIAVVLGGYAALAVAAGGAHRRALTPTRDAPAARDASLTGPAIVAFLALALVQNQDVLLANALLRDADAGRFAVLSTLGGLAAFATTTVPLVLLPRARGGDRGALAAAIGAAAALGLAAVAVVAIAPGDLIALAFGERFRGAGSLAAPYVGAMALLGVARVLVAQRCARGAGRSLAVALLGVAALHALLILAFGRTPGAIAACTFAAATLLVGASAGGAVIPFPALRARGGTARTGGPAQAAAVPRDRRPLIVLAAITAGALLLRLLCTRGLWLDEATSVTQAELPLNDMLRSLRTGDVHPPLHHVVLWATVHLFGNAEIVVRAPSIIAGTLLVPVMWATGRELYGPRAGVAAAVLGALSPFAVWYAQEARMYAFFMLFATVALLAQLRAMRTGERRWWLAFAAAGAALVWTQYFAAMVVAVLHAATALQLWRQYRRGEPVRDRLLGWLGALALTALVLLPLVHFAMDQFNTNESAGRGFNQSPSQAGNDVSGGRSGPGVYSGLTNVVWAIWGYHSAATMAALTALWPALMLLALLLLGRGRPGRTGLVVAVAALPALGMTILGVAKPFLFEARYFVALTPMALLLLARAATGWTASRTGAVLCTGGLALTLGLGTADQQLNRSNPRLYDFQGALNEVQNRARPGDVVLYEPDYLGDLVRYLQPGMVARPLDKGIPKPDGGRHQVFLLGSFQEMQQYAKGTARGLTDLKHSGRRQVGYFRKPQVKVWVYR